MLGPQMTSTIVNVHSESHCTWSGCWDPLWLQKEVKFTKTAQISCNGNGASNWTQMYPYIHFHVLQPLNQPKIFYLAGFIIIGQKGKYFEEKNDSILIRTGGHSVHCTGFWGIQAILGQKISQNMAPASCYGTSNGPQMALKDFKLKSSTTVNDFGASRSLLGWNKVEISTQYLQYHALLPLNGSRISQIPTPPPKKN